MNKLPITPNNRKAQKRDSSNIDADKIKNLTLGEIQEYLMSSTLRAKDTENTLGYGISKAASYSPLGYSIPSLPEEVVSRKNEVQNWLDEQKSLNEEEPYNYLTFGAFKQWARSVINLIGKSGDTQSIDLYFCDSEGNKIESIDRNPLEGKEPIYFKFCKKTLGENELSDSSFLTVTIDGYKGRDGVISLISGSSYLYKIEIDIFQYKPRNSFIDFKLTYQESDYEVEASLRINIPEWSVLLINNNNEISSCILSGETVDSEELPRDQNSIVYKLLVLHNCYYYNYSISNGSWIIDDQKLARGEIECRDNFQIANYQDFSILDGESSFYIYDLTIKYHNDYCKKLSQILSIQNDDFEFNINLQLEENIEQLYIATCSLGMSTESVNDLYIGDAGAGGIKIGKSHAITIPSALAQPFDLTIRFNFVEEDTLEDQYINCYGSDQNSEYIIIESVNPDSSFISSNIEEDSDKNCLYTIKNIQVSKLNTIGSNVSTNLYFAFLTREEDLEFRDSGRDLYSWIENRRQKTEFPILKVIIKIKSFNWSALLNYPINSSGNYLTTSVDEYNNYLFEIIPTNDISNQGKYNFQFKITTTNSDSAEQGISGNTPQPYWTDIQQGGIFNIELSELYKQVVNGRNVYAFNVVATINPEVFYSIDNENDFYSDIKFSFRSDSQDHNTVTIRIIPGNIAIYEISSGVYRFVQLKFLAEVVQFDDCLSKSKTQTRDSYTNYGESFSYSETFPQQPVGSLHDGSEHDGLRIPYDTEVNEGAWPQQPDYFYGLLEVGIHYNNDFSPKLFISTRFDDWIVGIYINRSVNNKKPLYRYETDSPGANVGNNEKNKNNCSLMQFGPINLNYLKKGKNTIEFLARNPVGDSFFQCALTSGLAITKSNYRSTFNYDQYLRKLK